MGGDRDGAEGLRAFLGRDHQRLQALLAELLDEFEQGNRDDVRGMWDRFETGLSAHLAAEEEHLMPLFAKVEPAEAAELLADHAAFRRRLEDLGVGIDLHAVKLAAAREFVEALRAHSRREDRLLYRWAEGIGRPGPAEIERALSEAAGKRRG